MDFDYVGESRLLRCTYGNGAVTDKRNTALTQSNSGPGAGFDANGRDIFASLGGGRQRDRPLPDRVQRTEPGLGTNSRDQETRVHLFGRKDDYGFDSAYRQTSFTRSGQVASTRSLDGVDKMLSFSDVGVNRAPIVDGDPAEAGLNQYSSFDGVRSRVRLERRSRGRREGG